MDVKPDAVFASDDGPIADVSAPPKTRLEVARTALSNAEKCRRYRERKKATDPNYLSREAARLRELREAMKRQQA